MLIRSGAVALVAALAVAGCSASSDDEPQTAASPTPTPTASETPYLPVPSGVQLTTPGSQLSVGDHAVVAYRPRQDEVGALDIRVTSLQKTSIDAFDAWQLKPAQRKSNPYYVRATIENVGDTDLGGRPVPLYVVNEQNVLLEATPFASSFEPCPSTPFPERFKPGDRTRACLVYLAPNHGDLVSVSFRPEETFNPITWSGQIEKYQPPNPTNPQSPGKPGKSGDSKKQNDR